MFKKRFPHVRTTSHTFIRSFLPLIISCTWPLSIIITNTQNNKPAFFLSDWFETGKLNISFLSCPKYIPLSTQRPYSLIILGPIFPTSLHLSSNLRTVTRDHVTAMNFSLVPTPPRISPSCTPDADPIKHLDRPRVICIQPTYIQHQTAKSFADAEFNCMRIWKTDIY